MEYTTLGKTGLKVSVAGLGCGGPSRLGMRDNLASRERAIGIVRQAIDLGINFIDTAQSYETEGIVGKAIWESMVKSFH
jgi:aryl-alcohol dehydrogenase-like predicted oxidoreductase